MRSWGEVTKTYPENSKAGLDEKGRGGIFEESLDKMEATTLTSTPDTTEAVVQPQELRTEMLNVNNIRSLEDQLYNTAYRTKRALGNGGSHKMAVARRTKHTSCRTHLECNDGISDARRK
jgi:hypothetical protein